MPRPGFYNENRNRAFPFIKGTVGISGAAGTSALPDSAVVDCGFVVGTSGGFDPASDVVRLARVTRSGDTFTFHFANTSVPGSTLAFSRDLSDAAYATEYADADFGYSASDSGEPCDEPPWSGYMVSGRLDALAAILPPGDELLGSASDAVVEPALIQNLSGSYVNMLACANQDRTRVTAPSGCDEVSWPFDPGEVYANASCLTGDVLLRPGYNATLRVDPQTNSLVMGASVGAGEGEPCEESSLFDGESPPPGDGLLSGGPGCDDVLRSINGVGGPKFEISAGTGVTVTPVPGENKVVIGVDLTGLPSCEGYGSVISVWDV